jgi:hypothetical protein
MMNRLVRGEAARIEIGRSAPAPLPFVCLFGWVLLFTFSAVSLAQVLHRPARREWAVGGRR